MLRCHFFRKRYVPANFLSAAYMGYWLTWTRGINSIL